MLTKLWNLLSHSCKHEWETFHAVDVRYGGLIVGREYHQKCTKCGTIKRKKFKH